MQFRAWSMELSHTKQRVGWNCLRTKSKVRTCMEHSTAGILDGEVVVQT